MARVTVEDCIVHVPNRFDLLLLAAHRAKQISSGNPLTVDRDNDKDAVVALREIADLTVNLDTLREEVIQGFFRKPMTDIADKKLLEKDTDKKIDEQIQEAFKDAASHVSEDTSGEGSVLPAAGMSFEDENVQAND